MEKFCPIIDEECIHNSFICDDCNIYTDFLEDSEIIGQDELEESPINPFDCFDDDDLLIKFTNYEDLLEINIEDLPF